MHCVYGVYSAIIRKTTAKTLERCDKRFAGPTATAFAMEPARGVSFLRFAWGRSVEPGLRTGEGEHDDEVHAPFAKLCTYAPSMFSGNSLC